MTLLNKKLITTTVLVQQITTIRIRSYKTPANDCYCNIIYNQGRLNVNGAEKDSSGVDFTVLNPLSVDEN